MQQDPIFVTHIRTAVDAGRPPRLIVLMVDGNNFLPDVRDRSSDPEGANSLWLH
jgi:hypothetical protein